MTPSLVGRSRSYTFKPWITFGSIANEDSANYDFRYFYDERKQFRKGVMPD